MNLKSLLIGSAAALVAAPAFAADVIIAEPEPVEYVEVCDVAGAGYFYIPGSRTCIKLSGLVRHELSFDSNTRFTNRSVTNVGAVAALPARPGVVGGVLVVLPAQPAVAGNQVTRFNEDQDGIQSLVRAELTVDTFSETELGDLTSRIKFRANSFNADDAAIVPDTETGELNNFGTSRNDSVFLQEATIGLGGLLLGKTDTLYDGGINGEFDSFGGDRVHTIRYTADLGAFSASLGLEAERETISRFNYVPNVVGKLSGDLGAFSVDLFAAYDDEDDIELRTQFLNAAGVPTVVNNRGVQGEDEFALKAIVGADFGPAALQLGGTYNSGVNYYSNGFEYSVAASAKFGLGEKASLTFGGQYFANAQTLVATNVNATTFNGSTIVVGRRVNTVTTNRDAFSVGANVDYEIVDGFDVKVAVNYRDTTANNNNRGDFDGFIRFDRSF